ncbi:phospholipase A1-Ibeta2, chloroplastic-like [Magnolia sinica]|uniref:phospholipase A1-Ibeta2, chloroplastic-like n=1 Tax=Magnolia sinica TaxID=86752 RepID=UPI002659DFC6|nr:phospholipase A1-Ibeta2, chloroplastic-like [Magnolia sinica]
MASCQIRVNLRKLMVVVLSSLYKYMHVCVPSKSNPRFNATKRKIKNKNREVCFNAHLSQQPLSSQMHFGSMVSAPTQPAFRLGRVPATHHVSPLNPLRRTRAAVQTLQTSTFTAPNLQKPTDSIRAHLSNLERLLQKDPSHLPDLPQKDSGKSSVPENKGRGVLDGLNLGGIWPGSRKAEEMSPRHMNNLQRLLSRSPEYSPRNNIGKRWPEYHGCNDWAGLLDPLDENLRREVVRYGEFVQAAYQSFHSNPATSAGDPPSPRHVALPDRSYRVTKSLYATSSVGLPAWVDDMAPDLEWMTQRSSRIGYVAVCESEKEIARMGRRDIVISLRGTSTCLEWAENFRATLVQVPPDDGPSSSTNPKVECGFWSLYKTRGAHVPSLSEAIVEEVRRLSELYKGEPLSISVTGHSLGAALALLAADELSTCFPHMPPVAVFSFGGPRVGNRGFADRIKANGVKVLRVVNAQDVITKVPGMPVGEGLDQKLSVLEATPWAYSHVGSELRVDSKRSPYLKPNADVACCHDLEAYLHLVDGFLASNCPFRTNAKRSPARLLHEQGSNVKKLYTYKDLTLNLETMVGSTPSCLPSPS